MAVRAWPCPLGHAHTRQHSLGTGERDNLGKRHGARLANTAQVTSTTIENLVESDATVTPTLSSGADLLWSRGRRRPPSRVTPCATPMTVTESRTLLSLAQNVRVTDTLPGGRHLCLCQRPG